MSKYPQTAEACLTKFERDLQTSSSLSPRTITFYRETAHAVTEILRAQHLQTLPHMIKEHDVRQLLDWMARNNLAIATRKGYMSALKKYCNHYGNNIVGSVMFQFPHDRRPKVDWLDPDDARKLLACDKSPIQEITIHCELCLGMRRVEVVRLRTSDLHFNEGYVIVTGKGPQGGKPRTVPFARETLAVLQRWLAVRDEMIGEALKRYPVSTVIPDNVVLWLKAGRLHPYSEEGYGLDKVVTLPLSKSLGFHFSNHTLRRTFGRAMFRAGVPTETIAKILGHESTEVTLRYIGVDLDDMRRAMATPLF